MESSLERDDINMESGIYIRVDNENVLLEDMSYDEREQWLKTLEDEGLRRTVHVLCNTIRNIKTFEE